MTTTSHPLVPTRAGAVAAVMAVTSWGLGNVLAKYIRLSGPSLAFNRMWIGAIVYGLVLIATGGMINVKALRTALPGGVAFGLDVVLFFTALKHTSVADATIISALQPALVFLVAGRLFGERLTRRHLGWTALALAGVCLAVVGSSTLAGRTLEGDLIASASLLAWAWYFVASKRCRQRMGAIEYQASMTIIAAIVITPIALATSHDLVIHSASTAGWVLVMVLGPGGGHLLMNWAHEHTHIMWTSTITLGIPVVATIGAAAFLSEPVTAAQAAGIALAIVALAMIVGRPASGAAAAAQGLPGT